MTTQLTATTYSYNPITGGASYGNSWVYNYISDITISDSKNYVYNWGNPTGVVIPIVYVLIVGEGGIGVSGDGNSSSGGNGGSGGGQVSLFQFNNVQPGDIIQINYNEASGNSSYCYLTYFSGGIAQNLTEIDVYYYNTPDYATGTNLSTIIFSNNNFTKISNGGPLVPLLINNNTNIVIYYGGEGKNGGSTNGYAANGGNGGTGGGGSGGGGGNYAGGSNGSRGTQNYNLGTYGGMKGGTSDSSDCREGGYTPLCMPDGTGTSSLPAGALLGNAGGGNDGSTGSNSAGESGDPGSIMVFYPTN